MTTKCNNETDFPRTLFFNVASSAFQLRPGANFAFFSNILRRVRDAFSSRVLREVSNAQSGSSLAFSRSSSLFSPRAASAFSRLERASRALLHTIVCVFAGRAEKSSANTTDQFAPKEPLIFGRCTPTIFVPVENYIRAGLTREAKGALRAKEE